MNTALRVAAGAPGVLFGIQGLQWLLVPSAAAEGLGMTLLDGAGRSTQIGDMAAFFLGLSAMILYGVVRLEARWLRVASYFLFGAALCRTAAWALHAADFTASFIGVEVVVGALLAFAASRTRDEA